MKNVRKSFIVLLALLSVASFVAFLAWRFYFLPLDHHSRAGAYGLGNYYFEMAEKHLRIALKYNPFSRDLKGDLGRALVEIGKYEEAEPLLKERLAKDSGFNYLYLGALTKLCIAQNRLDEAEQYAWQLEKSDKRLAELGGPLTDAYSHLTEIYRRRGDYRRVERYAIAAIRNARYHARYPSFLRTEPMKVMIDIFTETQRFEEAKKGIELLARLYPEEEAGMTFELAKTNEYLKNKGDAIKTWEKFLHISKDYSDRTTLNNFQKERAFAKQRLIEIEKGNFLTPPSPKNRLNWGEIPKIGINTPDQGPGPK